MSQKRISFDRHHAAHLFEMAMEHLCHMQNCFTCEVLYKRLSKFVRAKETKEIRKILRKNGYCNKLKGQKI